jgi:transposase
VFGLGPATRIYVALGATDMRKGFDGLYGLVRDKLGLEVTTGHLFLFANSKRLERGRFSWPLPGDQSDRVMLSHEELSLLLGGIDLTRTRISYSAKTLRDFLTLSGRSQQKVALASLARWLTYFPKVLILSEPTRGMDIGTVVSLDGKNHDLVSHLFGHGKKASIRIKTKFRI